MQSQKQAECVLDFILLQRRKTHEEFLLIYDTVHLNDRHF